MNHSSLKRTTTTIFGATGAMLLALLLFGCASNPPAPPPAPDKDKLVAAGFKVVDATTQLQQERLQALPQGRVSERQRTGNTFWVYPDPAKKQLYVGTQKEYDTYRLLYPGAGADSLAQQHAADEAAYNKQDARMGVNTSNDLSDPWSLWDNVEGLGGR